MEPAPRAGIVDHDRRIAQIIYDPARHLLHVVRIAYVSSVTARDAAIRDYGGGNRFDLGRARQHRNARPGAAKRFSRCLADAARGTCNHDRLTIDLHDLKSQLARFALDARRILRDSIGEVARPVL